ncbi:MAG: hypothetical protein HXS44_11775 [Theionarchaea archaeon]|nr:hypothetical protein [Theionarchaea archaeon]
MKKQLSEHLQKFLRDYVSRYQIEMKRGEIDFLASQMIDYYSSISLPCVSDPQRNLEQKMLYCLWNLIVDDCTDHGGDGEYLLADTLDVVSCLWLGISARPKTQAGNVMNELIRQVLSMENCNTPVGHAFFFLDMISQVKAFCYEQIVYRRTDLATFSEYEEHSAITHDPRICLDIDICTTTGDIISQAAIKMLREVYRLLGLAFKLQGDVVTFEREFFKEKSPNSVILLGIERRLLPYDILDLTDSEKGEFLTEIVPHIFEEIWMRSLDYRDHALEKLHSVEDMDLSSLEQTILYFTEKEFPGKKIEEKV